MPDSLLLALLPCGSRIPLKLSGVDASQTPPDPLPPLAAADASAVAAAGAVGSDERDLGIVVETLDTTECALLLVAWDDLLGLDSWVLAVRRGRTEEVLRTRLAQAPFSR